MKQITERISILRESELRLNARLLGDAWDSEQSLILIPDKLQVTKEWLTESIASVPEDFTTKCFGLLTSGSTGLPKIIIGTKERAENMALVIHEHQHAHEVKETIVCLPLTYSYAFVNQWVWSKVLRRALVLSDGIANPESLKKLFLGADQAMTCMVGAQIPILLSHFEGIEFPGVIRLNFAGGRFPQEHLSRIHSMFPCAAIFNNYGCAEALPRLTVRAESDASDPTILGHPLPGVELLTDDVGSLLFRSDFRAVAIVENRVFRAISNEEWLATGDLGHKLEDGRWQLLGRKSEVFKRYGEKISIASVHHAMQRVWQGNIGFYRDVDNAGEDGYIMVLSPWSPGGDIKSILAELRKSFSRAHWPLRIEGTSSIPLLPSNKVDGLKLKELKEKALVWIQRQ